MAKLTVMFKMPDAVSDAIRQAQVDGQINSADAEKAEKLGRKFFLYGEYAHIEIDTEKKTAKVLKLDKEHLY